MWNAQFRKPTYGVRSKFPDHVDVFNASGHVQRFVEFAQHEVAEVMALEVLWLIEQTAGRI
jgi:hypothetical protein